MSVLETVFASLGGSEGKKKGRRGYQEDVNVVKYGVTLLHVPEGCGIISPLVVPHFACVTSVLLVFAICSLSCYIIVKHVVICHLYLYGMYRVCGRVKSECTLVLGRNGSYTCVCV